MYVASMAPGRPGRGLRVRVLLRMWRPSRYVIELIVRQRIRYIHHFEA